MHLIEALIEAATGNNRHNCSWNSPMGRFCQEHGPSTRATYSGIRTSEFYYMQGSAQLGSDRLSEVGFSGVGWAGEAWRWALKYNYVPRR